MDAWTNDWQESCEQERQNRIMETLKKANKWGAVVVNHGSLYYLLCTWECTSRVWHIILRCERVLRLCNWIIVHITVCTPREPISLMYYSHIFSFGLETISVSCMCLSLMFGLQTCRLSRYRACPHPFGCFQTSCPPGPEDTGQSPCRWSHTF